LGHVKEYSTVNLVHLQSTLKIHELDDLHTETMTCSPQINTYAVVEKETGHRGGQR